MALRILLIILGIASLSACFKFNDIEPKPDLPPLTTEGKNTFGCYNNGVPWEEGTPSWNLGGSTLDPTFYLNGTSWGDSVLSIIASKYYEDGLMNNLDLIYLKFYPKQVDNLKLLSGDQDFKRYFDDYQNFPTCIYQIDTTKVHEVNLVRFDLEERIASGTFEMTLYNTTSCNDTLVITEGRFDVNFQID